MLSKAFGVLCLSALAGCAAQAPEGALIADPWERTNREIHEFNTGVDLVLLRPVSFVYREATPALFQFLVANFAEHLRLPIIAINDVLQGEFERGVVTVGRFGVNTLVGAGGLLDPATEFGLDFASNDGGVTLARAGFEEGNFVVLPLLGATTVRDGFGRVLDFALDPFSFVRMPNAATEVAKIAVPIVDVRSRNFELIDEVLYETEDSYVTIRAATVQNLRRRLRDRDSVDPESLPDIFAE